MTLEEATKILKDMSKDMISEEERKAIDIGLRAIETAGAFDDLLSETNIALVKLARSFSNHFKVNDRG